MQRLSILFYEYVPDVVERRAPHREAHLAKLRELHDAGACLMGGVLGDPPHGAAIVFRDADTAQRFVSEDPYVSAGLVTAHRIEPWTLAVS